MENKKQQTKAPLAPNKSQQQPARNPQMPSHNDNHNNNHNSKLPNQKKPGSNW